MKMNIGDMRHKITITSNEAAEGQTDSNGFPVENWKTVLTTYAKRTGLKGHLFYQAAAARAETDIMYTIRYQDGIEAGMRVVDLSEIYEIKVPPIDPDGRRLWLEIHTRQVLQNGG